MMRARKSNIYFFYAVLSLACLALMFVHAHQQGQRALPALRQKAELVKNLQLTDLCLFTDARYSRNPSMGDFHAAFQDSPMVMEHFPSGTILPPPPHLSAP